MKKTTETWSKSEMMLNCKNPSFDQIVWSIEETKATQKFSLLITWVINEDADRVATEEEAVDEGEA